MDLARTLLLSAIAVGLLAFATVPTGSAATSCNFALHTWDVTYNCRVSGVGGSGTASWCPDPFSCLDANIITCYGTLVIPCVIL